MKLAIFILFIFISFSYFLPVDAHNPEIRLKFMRESPFLYKEYYDILNDIDVGLITFLKNLYPPETGKEFLQKCIDQLNKIKTHDEIITTKKNLKHSTDPMDYFIYHNISDRFGSYKRSTKYEEIFIENYKLANKFFMNENIHLRNKDYMNTINKYKDMSNTIIFLDPPYLSSSNVSYQDYNKTGNGETIKDNTQMYIELLDVLKTSKALIVLVINDNAINRYIYKNYIINTYDKIYQTMKKRTKHILISNVKQIKKI